MAQNYYDSFVKELRDIFMMDHAELDFGIYRIMNQKRNEIDKFLTSELLPQVKSILASFSSEDQENIKKRLKVIEDQAASFGVSADSNPEYVQLKEKLTSSTDTAAIENEIFSHLTTFFSRYYDEGDFISKRRYKDDTYAIPYNGEEVKLYWANADQYYIKTSEYFHNHTFLLPNSKRKVHFVLKDASTEQNNNKAANNMERRFALYKNEDDAPFLEVVDDELNIYFTYELMEKGTKQDALMEEAFAAISTCCPEDFLELLTYDKKKGRTLLEKHLTDYTAKNSFDYFIHKDLGGFLRRELDFYIKNEVMLLDDLDAKHIEHQLGMIKAIKLIGEKIIRMLAQLEDFQKRLWLKKKFVVQCDYCITLDRVPESLYPEIIANDQQRKEWVKLFAINEIKGDVMHEGYSEPLTETFLHQNPFLVLDTAFFSTEFKHKLIRSIENIDEQCNGLLINSENFQALNLLQNKYTEEVDGIYIDPPYNTNASEIIYKNGYKNSTWATLINDRILISRKLLKSDCLICVTIDDFQLHELFYILSNIYGRDNHIGTVSIKNNPQGRSTITGFQLSHEYGLFFGKANAKVNSLERNKNQLSRYGERDEKGPYEWRNLRAQYSQESQKMIYPIFIKKDCSDFRLPNMVWNETTKSYQLNENISDNEIMSLPIDESGRMRTWKYSIETLIKMKDSNELGVRLDRIGNPAVYYKGRMRNEGMQPFTIWDKPEYSASTFGANILADILGSNLFSYPKSIYAVEDTLKIESHNNKALFLDFFAGSGTTGHAVISLNRKDHGKRKYILCEMGLYFDNVTRTRIEKVIYSSDWKDKKPVSRNGISQCFKYIRLEQYEDTLNNLQLQQSKGLFKDGSEFKESYMLSYMLDTETRDSLLNIKMFENPFTFTIKTTKDNELVDTPVDMVETFNYLIGLNVETESWYENSNVCVVTGRTHKQGDKTLVIWRNCKEIDNEKLNRFFEKMDFRTKDSEFDVIYVNGDNTLPNLRRDEESWKVILIEEEFQKRMFDLN